MSRAAAASPPAEAVGAPTSEAVPAVPEPVVRPEPGSPEARRRSAWARVLRKVFEVDPLPCPTCGTPMKGVAWITDPVVIERILAHGKRAGLESPFDARGPPDAWTRAERREGRARVEDATAAVGAVRVEGKGTWIVGAWAAGP